MTQKRADGAEASPKSPTTSWVPTSLVGALILLLLSVSLSVIKVRREQARFQPLLTPAATTEPAAAPLMAHMSGPMIPGLECYESVDLDDIEVSPELRVGMQRPFYDFVMAPNVEAAAGAHEGLDDPKRWDARLMQFVMASMQKHAQAWRFYMRLDQIKDSYSRVAREMQSKGLPVVFAAIPYAESRYNNNATSSVCAKGYWQFMPEVANRVDRRGGIAFKVKGCRFQGRPNFKWSPKLLAPPVGVVENGDYMQDGECLISTCDRDDRTDLDRSTAAAIYTLGEAYNDPELRRSGAIVQITITSHNTGYLDEKYGVPHSSNVLPAYRKWVKKAGDDQGPYFYGENIKCADRSPGKGWCGSLLPPEPQHYAYNIIAQHLVAVCYYAQNYGDDPMYRQWVKYLAPSGYCSELDTPTKEAVQQRGHSAPG